MSDPVYHTEPQKLSPAQLLSALDQVVDGESAALFEGVVDLSKLKAARDAVNTNPTAAQKDSGNYSKGHITYSGLSIAIENPAGSYRSGVGEDGKAWKVRMVNDYGYIKRTEGADNDPVDVFLGNDHDSDQVFVINQLNPSTGEFDEHKVMLGFRTEQAAKAAKAGYLSNYEAGWKGIGSVIPMSEQQFKAWLGSGDMKQPVAPIAERPILESTPSNIAGCYREMWSTKSANEIVALLDLATGAVSEQESFYAIYGGALKRIAEAETSDDASIGVSMLITAGGVFPPDVRSKFDFSKIVPHITAYPGDKEVWQAVKTKLVILSARRGRVDPSSYSEGAVDTADDMIEITSARDYGPVLMKYLMGSWDIAEIKASYQQAPLEWDQETQASIDEFLAKLSKIPQVELVEGKKAIDIAREEFSEGRAMKVLMRKTKIKDFAKQQPELWATLKDANERMGAKLLAGAKTGVFDIERMRKEIKGTGQAWYDAAVAKLDHDYTANVLRVRYSEFLKSRKQLLNVAGVYINGLIADIVYQSRKEAKDASALRLLVDAVISEAPITDQEVSSLVRATEIKISAASLVYGYSMDEMKGDLAEFYKMSAGRLKIPKIVRNSGRAYASSDGKLNAGESLDRVTLWHELGHFVEF
ncbi:MAG: hypothetical protein ACRC9V_05250, partial [Aeromonas sp.]